MHSLLWKLTCLQSILSSNIDHNEPSLDAKSLLYIFKHVLFSSCNAGHKEPHRRHRNRLKRKSPSSLLSNLETLNSRLFSAAIPSENKHNFTNESSDSKPRWRSKRFLSYPRFVEVMVVADSKMVEHHGSNLQHYILTLMSIVSSAQLTIVSWFDGFGSVALGSRGGIDTCSYYALMGQIISMR